MKKKNKKGTFMKIVLLLLIVCILICAYYKIKENTFTTTFYDIDSEKIYEDIRIVNLSDLHLKEFGKNNEKLVKRVRALSPDIITISGDMTNKDNSDFSVVYTLCKQLVKIAPTYYCLGNHEYINYYLKIIVLFQVLKMLE